MKRARSIQYGGSKKDLQKVLKDGRYKPIRYKDCNKNKKEWYISEDCEHILKLLNKTKLYDNEYEYVWQIWTYNPETAKNQNNYHVVRIGFTALLHQVVATTFLGIPPYGKNDVHHKDFDKNNNHYSNLVWMSHREHMKLHKGLEKQLKEETI